MNFSVAIKADHEGYTGRECPKCEKYFKIKFGTGLPGDPGCYCPYCNHHGPHNEFWTKQQIEYAHSVALNKVSGDLLKTMKKMERKPKRNSFLSIGITVKGRATPITYYSEQELEEKVTCDNCTLQYTIYGAFGHCPDCGVHNSKQIVLANFDLVLKILDLANSHTDDIKNKLVENALEDCISAFDGFAREHCSGLYERISFQNISAAKKRLLDEHQIDISKGFSENEWQFISEQFQKRHLLAHKMGVVDEEYIRKTTAPAELLGRKVPITEENVRSLINSLQLISNNLVAEVIRIN